MILANNGGSFHIAGGGDITIWDSNVKENAAEGGSGGFLYSIGCSINISNVTNNQSAAFKVGGFVYLESSILNMNDVTSVNSFALLGGGSIAAFNNNNTSVINNCTFESHRSAQGGALFISTSHLVCNDCNSISNTADLYGGFLLMDEGSNVVLNNANLFNDTATNC